MRTTTDAPTCEVAVQYAVEDGDLPWEADFRRWAAAAVAGERPGAELCIRLVGEAEGRALNREYRGLDYATNVLAFPADSPPGIDSPLLGDLAICAPVVLAEARDQGKAGAAHFAHMTVHGTLHLLGYDHQAEQDAAAMEAREAEVLGELGFPNPYGNSTL